MPLGIGAGGDAGIAAEVLAPPVQAAPATSTSGGTLPTASTYRYYVTAINAFGETVVSNEQTITTGAGSTNSNTVNWATVTGATGFKIYRTAAGGATGTELLLTTVGLVITFVDTGALTPSGALPTFNTAAAPGTYVAPTKYFPFLTESIKYMQDTVWRRPIRQSADVIGLSPGNAHIEGDIEMEAFEDVLPYFFLAARMTCVKSGSSPNFVYTFVPSNTAIPPRTFSLTLERVGGVVFGYTGMVVSAIKFTIDNGLLKCTLSLLGQNEASAAQPTPSYVNTAPFGAGQYSIEIPTGTPVTDTDVFEFDIDDQGEPQYRLKNTGRGAQFIKYGERTSTTHFERDFNDRTDYDNFKAYVAQTVTMTMSKGSNNSISLLAPNATKDTYEVNLSGQGDLVRGVIQYQNVLSASPATYQITIKTQEVVA